MTYLTWQPVRDLARVQDEVTRALENVFEPVEPSTFLRRSAPAVDIAETEADITLFADLPGYSRGDVDVSVENQILTLSGERKAPILPEDATTHRTERAFGRFARTFALPNTIDVARIQAELKDGVLRVQLPKAQEARPRKIEIHTA